VRDGSDYTDARGDRDRARRHEEESMIELDESTHDGLRAT
jgi:hypothetical protein